MNVLNIAAPLSHNLSDTHNNHESKNSSKASPEGSNSTISTNNNQHPTIGSAKPSQGLTAGGQATGLRPPGHIEDIQFKSTSELYNLSMAKSTRDSTQKNNELPKTPERLYSKSYTSSELLPQLNTQEAGEALHYLNNKFWDSTKFKDLLDIDTDIGANGLHNDFKNAGYKITKEIHRDLGGRTIIEELNAGAEGENLGDHRIESVIKTPSGARATIRYDKYKKEVVVNFTGLTEGTKSTTARQVLAVIKNWLGFRPAAFDDAEFIVKKVKEWTASENSNRADNEKIKLTVTGFSFGGALASYAALRNEVPGIVFNPLRIGLGARAKIGQENMHKASQFLTEVVVSSDWVSDPRLHRNLRRLNPLSWVGLVHNNGALGNARRFVVPHLDGKLDGDAHQIRAPLNAVLKREVFMDVASLAGNKDYNNLFPKQGMFLDGLQDIAELQNLDGLQDIDRLNQALVNFPQEVLEIALHALGFSPNLLDFIEGYEAKKKLLNNIDPQEDKDKVFAKLIMDKFIQRFDTIDASHIDAIKMSFD